MGSNSTVVFVAGLFTEYSLQGQGQDMERGLLLRKALWMSEVIWEDNK